MSLPVYVWFLVNVLVYASDCLLLSYRFDCLQYATFSTYINVSTEATPTGVHVFGVRQGLAQSLSQEPAILYQVGVAKCIYIYITHRKTALLNVNSTYYIHKPETSPTSSCSGPIQAQKSRDN